MSINKMLTRKKLGYGWHISRNIIITYLTSRLWSTQLTQKSISSMTSFSVLHIDIEMQLNGSTYGNYFGTLKLKPAETE